MFPSPQDVSSVVAFDLGVLIAMLMLTKLLSRDDFPARLIFGVVAATIIVTYAAWRWFDTIPPFEWTIASLWPRLFFCLRVRRRRLHAAFDFDPHALDRPLG